MSRVDSDKEKDLRDRLSEESTARIIAEENLNNAITVLQKIQGDENGYGDPSLAEDFLEKYFSE